MCQLERMYSSQVQVRVFPWTFGNGVGIPSVERRMYCTFASVPTEFERRAEGFWRFQPWLLSCVPWRGLRTALSESAVSVCSFFNLERFSIEPGRCLTLVYGAVYIIGAV